MAENNPPEILPYDVCQIQRESGEWVDYATIRDPSDVDFAVRLVRESGGFHGHPVAEYLIVRGGRCEVVFRKGKP